MTHYSASIDMAQRKLLKISVQLEGTVECADKLFNFAHGRLDAVSTDCDNSKEGIHNTILDIEDMKEDMRCIQYLTGGIEKLHGIHDKAYNIEAKLGYVIDYIKHHGLGDFDKEINKMEKLTNVNVDELL